MRFFFPILAVFFTLLAVETSFRIHHYLKLGENEINFLYVPQMFFEFNEQTGYRYKSNQDLTLSWFVESGNVVRTNHVVTNNHGHVSARPDSYPKPKGEFRIAIVGDSLAACIHNDLPWANTLEDLLNQDLRLKQKLHVRSFKVLNLALDGIGVSQMTSVIEHEASKYAPDLTLVNFITADIYRKFSWRTSVQPDPSRPKLSVVLSCVSLPAELSNKDCSYGTIISTPQDLVKSQEDLQQTRKTVSRLVAERVPWLNPYPQFLSWAMRGKLEELLGRNPYHPNTTNIDNREESIAVTASAIRKIRALDEKTDFLLTPTYWEIIYGAVPSLAGEVMDRVSEIPITAMLNYLPNIRDQKVVDTWTNHPYDMHWSNVGARLYAQAVHRYIRVKYKAESLFSSNATQFPYN